MTSSFVKSLFSFSMILIFTIGGAAQIDCGLAKAPALFGFQLGMLPEQAQATVGREVKIKIKSKNKGERIFFQNFIEKPAPNSLLGIRALYLRFFDGKLYQIEIFYEAGSDRKTLEDFTAALSTESGFSAAAWSNVKGKAVIDCGEFTVVADNALNPRVEITDENIRKKVEAIRREK
jgi:hypothetical protein